MKQNQEPKYLTPYVLGVSDMVNNTGDIGRFMARTLKLPPSVQNIFRNFTTAEFIEENPGQTFGLNADQKTELTRIIRDVLLADAFLGDFSALISSKLRVDMNIANQVANKIVNELFAPAIEDIKNMQREKFKDRINQSSAQPQQPQTNIRTEGNVVDLRNRNNQQ